MTDASSRTDRATISAGKRGLTLERDGRVWRFDAAGRLNTVFDGERVVRRGVDGTVVEKWWGEPRVGRFRPRRSRVLDAEAGRDRVAAAYDAAKAVLSDLESRAVATDDDARESIRRVLDTDPADLARDAEGFRSVYSPVGILPPDCYRAVVCQLTTGCPYDCSFCTLYDADGGVRSADAFDDHVRAVASAFGRGRQSRRGVFLGEANPLAADGDRLACALESIERHLPERHAEGIFAFGNAHTVARTPVPTLETLADRGLTRVYLGVESGDPDVLSLLRKPQDSDDVREAVERLAAAGVDVGAMLMAGVGGATYADDHVRRTVDLVTDLPLDSGDVVYLSPLVGTPGTTYAADARERGIDPLDERGVLEQLGTLYDRLADAVDPRVSTYQAADFVYF
ncbi:MAG: radical SAM protein [Halobacteriales archaeon]